MSSTAVSGGMIAIGSMPPETEARLTELFASDVDRLQALLGRDPPWPRFFGDHVQTSAGAPMTQLDRATPPKE